MQRKEPHYFPICTQQITFTFPPNKLEEVTVIFYFVWNNYISCSGEVSADLQASTNRLRRSRRLAFPIMSGTPHLLSDIIDDV